ncbi:MAG: hypothetical protein K0S21_2005 [Rhizobiaceae bacterium]|jgi:predicted small lipoprotein YifL|nr:hypothetical protein [Rhizobiaceae bacterium]
MRPGANGGCKGGETSLQAASCTTAEGAAGMASMTGSRVFFGLVLLAGVALSGCGRKAPLDTPYEAAVQAREDAAEAGQPVPPEPEQPRADRPFILDPLL